LAWDDYRYDYAALKGGDDSVVAVPMSKAQDFYFAVMQPSEGELTTVDTLDNNDYGISIKNLDYGTYRAVIQPRFTERYGHYETADGYKYFDVYVDAFRVYDPAGVDEDGLYVSTVIDEAYKYSGEAYETFSTLKSLIIGAETMGTFSEDEDDKQGAVLIDGNVALESVRLTDYLQFGPNNELYLDSGMSVAFNIQSDVIPQDVQIYMKKVSDKTPKLRLMYLKNGKIYSDEVLVATATDLSCSIIDIIGKSNITWTKTKNKNNKSVYSTGLMVLTNTGESDSLLSLTNLKWTYSDPTVKNQLMPSRAKLTVNSSNVNNANRMLSFTARNVDVESAGEAPVVSDGAVTVTAITDVGITSLVVRDEYGDVIDAENFTQSFEDLDNGQRQWTVTIDRSSEEEYAYRISAECDGVVDGAGKSFFLLVTSEDGPAEAPEGVFAILKEAFHKLYEIVLSILRLFGIEIVD
nr:hypothetical protein [Clostridia bacterium]